MLHDIEDEGSLWRVISGDKVVKIQSVRSQCVLHVRKTFNECAEGDKLMLVSDRDADDVGNLWELKEVRGPSGKVWHVLESIRARGLCLQLRPEALKRKDKGNMLTLSADKASPASHWHLRPGTGGTHSLRSVDSFVKGDVGAGKKFGLNGHWQAFPGWTMVCDLVGPSLFDSPRALVESSLAGRECLSDTLPNKSLHMTVCGLAEISNASVSALKTVLDEFALSAAKNGGVWACGVTVREPEERLNMHLYIESVEPKEAFAKLREDLKTLTGDAKDSKLHITLGWYWLWKPDDHKAAVCSLAAAHEAVDAVLKRNNRRLPLKFPHLANYPDMAHFPQTLSQNAVSPDATAKIYADAVNRLMQ